ncbi:MAG: 3,4-dehydroadipyl-CoA semialdehyde dehydrogenase [Planctomycetota bacterium]
MITLESYALGGWHAGNDDGRTLDNPTTEEPLARCSTTGIDFAAVLAHARETGGPALRAMGFGRRGELLKALSGALHEHRDELLDLSIQNGGNTRGDAKFDVDGAIGTLAAYASFAKGMDERGFLSDGDGTQLGRTARFWGQHILVPREGAAIHINAFNFPAWNMGEKMACALLAGVPVVEKPGTPSAMLAWRIAQIFVESGLLPEGSFQFLCGSAGDLLDHMGPQDVLAFTGSSQTGALLRGNPNLVQNNVHVNLEADSLNPALLAPDVTDEDETMDLFLSNLVIDITQKAGQKCTAARRVVVPADRVGEVVDGLKDGLARIRVGDPSSSETRMGPVASRSQLKDVRAGIELLASEAEIVLGGTDPVHDQGYFVTPTLLVASEGATKVHEHEVFGPVATIVPYSGDADEAVAMLNRGGGGLVASVYSNDTTWAERVVLGISPWHGRVWVGSDRVAEQALPPGMVLPASVHGGPGRAGGGEELGGLRGLEPYVQRTAVQGFQGFVAGTFGAPAS